MALQHSFPDYPQMIMGAIEELNEKEGSSKEAIIEFIESNYSDLPPSHATHVSHTLEKLKQTGQLLMLKDDTYILKPHHDDDVDVDDDGHDGEDDDDDVEVGPTNNNGLSLPMKRGRGRPPKPKVALPPGVVPPPARPRGRPPKARDDSLGPSARPIKAVSSGRPRGRPKKNPGVEGGASVVGPTTGVKRGRGRPKKT
ncbi:HMG-Y-related protein A [Beta vulgaris subsp. vulgaris]|uniref:HMG-Y-related protein A n=1 Tax=Beta vulgaris subsp. vulgaris TaxID=3555 RepID=UPI002036BA75|nr:HMG-Y-related protein A [Beta vulgaris subsp. vulgaris]